MDPQSRGEASRRLGSPWSSSSSSSGGDEMGAATATQSTLLETTECRQKQLNNEFNQLAAYLAKEKALEGLHKALGRIYNAYKRATA
jgi:hypothetical protein